MQTKLSILNKNKKKKYNSVENKKIYINSSLHEKSSNNINYNQDESLNTKRNIKNEDSCCSCLSNLSKYPKNNKKVIKNYYNQTNLNIINNNLDLYYKYLDYDKNNLKKSSYKRNSSSNIYLDKSNKLKNIERKKFLSNYDKKFTVQDNSTDNNNPKDKIKKLKYPSNLTQKAFNMNRNNLMINLNTNIVGDNLINEKLKVQKNLAEYRKLIDMKIDELINNKKRKVSNRKKKYNSCEKENKIYYIDKKQFKKISKYNDNSDYDGKSNKNNKFSSRNYKNINEINDANNIIQMRINDYGKRNINLELKKYNNLNWSDSKKKEILKKKEEFI